MRIPARYSHYVFGVIQSGLTCSVAAGIASTPFMDSGFAAHWLRSWATAWATMIPVVIISAPIIRRAVGRITESPSQIGPAGKKADQFDESAPPPKALV